MENKERTKKRKGFTLIELVIVVAIIGILALMVIPQFSQVTQDAKNRQWEANCQTVVSAVGMFQAAHGGDGPSAGADLNPYISGGFDAVTGPNGASYGISGGEFSSTYPGYTGTNPQYSGGRFTIQLASPSTP